MQPRTFLALLILVAGLTLAAVSYFFLTAPLGRPTAESFSNPRFPFASALFVVGVVSVFASAVVYEVLPDGRRQRGPQPGRPPAARPPQA